MNLKNKLMNKLKKSGGFTLIEMLIVVAIIAILVAISIPMISNSLNKAKESTDTANERSAKAAAMITYMTDGTTGEQNYDAVKGELVPTTTTPAGYGQCKDHKDGYLKVTIGADGEVTKMVWVVNGTEQDNAHTKS